jgi:hypothetical protein
MTHRLPGWLSPNEDVARVQRGVKVLPQECTAGDREGTCGAISTPHKIVVAVAGR